MATTSTQQSLMQSVKTDHPASLLSKHKGQADASHRRREPRLHGAPFFRLDVVDAVSLRHVVHHLHARSPATSSRPTRPISSSTASWTPMPAGKTWRAPSTSCSQRFHRRHRPGLVGMSLCRRRETMCQAGEETRYVCRGRCGWTVAVAERAGAGQGYRKAILTPNVQSLQGWWEGGGGCECRIRIKRR